MTVSVGLSIGYEGYSLPGIYASSLQMQINDDDDGEEAEDEDEDEEGEEDDDGEDGDEDEEAEDGDNCVMF